MDVQTAWIIVLSVSTPLAGVIGFAIQLRTVKKVRLENQKLQLEIERLAREAEKEKNRVVSVSTEEVEKYSDRVIVRYSAGKVAKPGRHESSTSPFEIALLVGFVFVCLYFVYDLYRLAEWLVEKF